MSEGAFYAAGTAFAFGLVAGAGAAVGAIAGEKHPILGGALGALAGATAVFVSGRSHCPPQAAAGTGVSGLHNPRFP